MYNVSSVHALPSFLAVAAAAGWQDAAAGEEEPAGTGARFEVHLATFARTPTPTDEENLRAQIARLVGPILSIAIAYACVPAAGARPSGHPSQASQPPCDPSPPPLRRFVPHIGAIA